jgi:hypothetical protein
MTLIQSAPGPAGAHKTKKIAASKALPEELPPAVRPKRQPVPTLAGDVGAQR